MYVDDLFINSILDTYLVKDDAQPVLNFKIQASLFHLILP